MLSMLLGISLGDLVVVSLLSTMINLAFKVISEMVKHSICMVVEMTSNCIHSMINGVCQHIFMIWVNAWNMWSILLQCIVIIESNSLE